MIHSLLSAAAAVVLLPAGTAFMAALLRPQLPPVQPARTAPAEWWKALPGTNLGVVPGNVQLSLTAGASSAVLSGSGGQTAVPVQARRDGVCALRFRGRGDGILECILPVSCGRLVCPTGAVAILHETGGIRVQVRMQGEDCCLVWQDPAATDPAVSTSR